MARPMDANRDQPSSSDLEKLFALSLDMLCVAGMDGYFKQMNPAFEQIWNQGAEALYGWTRAEVIGQNANHLLFANQQLPDIEAIQQALFTQGTWQGELHHVTKDQHPITVESRWTLVSSPTQEPKFILVVDTDITEKKQLEAQFLRAQRLESIGTLASGISHDLNNILTSPAMPKTKRTFRWC